MKRINLLLASIIFCFVVINVLEGGEQKENLFSVSRNDISDVKARIQDLPEENSGQKQKKAVLEFALSRAQGLIENNELSKASGLMEDILFALHIPADRMVRKDLSASYLSVMNDVKVTDGNPYLQRLVAAANRALSGKDVDWPVGTAEKHLFPEVRGDYGRRTVAWWLRNYLWLFSNPASPMKDDPELLIRFLRRATAFIDAYTHNHPDIYDVFAVEDSINAIVEFMALYPDMLLPSQRDAWDQGLKKAADVLWGRMKNSRGNTPNVTLASLVGVLNLGFYLGNEEMIERSMAIVDLIISKQKPGGAWPYHGDSNPSGYHTVVVNSLTTIYDQTGYEPIKKALINSQWRGPITGRTDEQWTWIFSKARSWVMSDTVETGNEAVAALSGNPYVRGLLDSNGFNSSAQSATWYRDDIPAKALPDNYTITDTNVNGARAWYGDFTYASTIHPGCSWSAGRETIMGAMTVDPGRGRVNSVLTSVTPRVRKHAEDIHRRGRRYESATGLLLSHMTGRKTVGRNFSSSAASGLINTIAWHAYNGSATDWQGNQVWIGLPDRIVGLVSTVPAKTDPIAYEITGVLRFISRGTGGAETLKKMEKIGDNHYRYGQLDILIHRKSGYTEVDVVELDYRRAGWPATELTFREPKGIENGISRIHAYSFNQIKVGSPNQPLIYPDDSDFRFMVEIRPVWTQTDADISDISEPGVLGLKVAVGGKSYRQWFNHSGNDITIDLKDYIADEINQSIWGTWFDNRKPFNSQVPKQMQLPSNEQMTLVTSAQAEDHLPGWESFEALTK